MDISNSLSFIVGILIALAAGWLGWQEWRRASLTEKVAIVERVVLAFEQMYPSKPGEKLGADRLGMVLARLEKLFPTADAAEIRELVEATVAKLNIAKAAGMQGTGRGYWTS